MKMTTLGITFYPWRIPQKQIRKSHVEMYAMDLAIRAKFYLSNTEIIIM
jgi:hypothetical protein